MPTKAEQQDAGNVVANLEAEVEELVRRRAEAVAQIHHAEERFEKLEARRAALSSRTFSGDEEAARELQDLEDEHDRTARSARVARSAVPEFDRMLTEARGRLREARVRAHRERYDELYRQSVALDPERDELAKRLAEVLDRQSDLHLDMVNAVRQYDGDGANSMFVSGNGTRDWLELAFARWLLR